MTQFVLDSLYDIDSHLLTRTQIALGEDGPTHQPIESLSHYRAMPNLHVWRPADG